MQEENYHFVWKENVDKLFHLNFSEENFTRKRKSPAKQENYFGWLPKSFIRMEMKRKNNLRRPREADIKSFRSALRNSFESVALAYTLVVLLTFGLIQSGEFLKFPFPSLYCFRPERHLNNLSGVDGKSF